MNKDSIIGKIESVTLTKSGETNGKKWNRYEVVIGGQKFTAFDDKFQKLIGAEDEWKFSIEDYTNKMGVQSQSKKLFNLPSWLIPRTRFSPSNMPEVTTDAQLDRIEKKLDAILGHLKGQNEPEIGSHVEDTMPF